jgi:hypothetical protein
VANSTCFFLLAKFAQKGKFKKQKKDFESFQSPQVRLGGGGGKKNKNSQIFNIQGFHYAWPKI